MRVAVLIPCRPDGGRRDELLRWTTGRLAALHPGYQIAVGHHHADEGPFNRSAALNRAAEQAAGADVYVVSDGDSFVAADQLERAALTAACTGLPTWAFDRFCYLDRPTTDALLAGAPEDPTTFANEFTLKRTVSSMLAIPADLWAAIGGADEGFVGWGGEDVALAIALTTVGRGEGRLPGDVWHLWHPPAPHIADDVFPARLARYEAAKGDRDTMLALLDGLRA